MHGINVEPGKFCIEKKAGPCGIVIFGASGDLTLKKLFPAVFKLFDRKLFSNKFFVLGCARSSFSDESFQETVKKSLADFDPVKVSEFSSHCFYQAVDYASEKSYGMLANKITRLESEHSTGVSRLFYLAVPPVLYADITENLGDAGLLDESQGFSRVIVEKPFGSCLKSARVLNRKLQLHLKETQIYRIDHYLGKETVQNIMMFRFANILFEPVWNHNYIDNVQITVAESSGVGKRAGYYEQAGVIRDMFQNHMLQMLAMVAMEPPASFAADNVRNEKVKLLKSIRRFSDDMIQNNFVIGQYTESESSPAYRAEKGVNADSSTDTYAAAKIYIDNWRWSSVPFYLRSGKALSRRVSEIAITFKKIPYSLFCPDLCCDDFAQNVLILNVQPDEGFSLNIQSKYPGPKLCIGTLNMDMKYREIFGGSIPDAYERLILDCMLGDQTLFIRSDDMEISWEILEPVLLTKGSLPLDFYKAGGCGPDSAYALLEKDNRKWQTEI